MFADDTNLCFEQNNLETAQFSPIQFSAICKEFNKIPQWDISNKFSLNTGETCSFLLFLPSQIENFLEILPTLKVNDNAIERVQSMKVNLGAF